LLFSRALSPAEIHYPAVEKEAAAIIEAIRKWRHFLTGRHFTLVTDQRSVAFMFDHKASNKIKNDKIMRWRTELSCYKYDVVYRPGVLNCGADAFLDFAQLLSMTLTNYGKYTPPSAIQV
jgi:hypothetical protein